MAEYDVEVIRKHPRRKTRQAGQRRLARMGRAFFLRPRLVLLLGVGAFLAVIGTPHLGWDYECRHPLRGGQPCESARWCAYYGVQGRRIVYPEGDQPCSVITLLPPDWARLFGG